MSKVHIYRGTHEWTEPMAIPDPYTGEPVPYHVPCTAEESFCGESGYEGDLQFAWDDPEESNCDLCKVEYGLYLLAHNT